MTTPTHIRNQRNAQALLAVATFKDRDAFIREIMADPELSRGDRAIIARLALHFDVKTGTLCIDYATVAAETLVSERTAMRAIAKTAALGRIEIEHRQGKTNNFRLLLAAGGVTNSCHPSKAAKRGDKSSPGGVTNRCHPLSEDLREGIGEAKASPYPVERENAPTARDSISIGGAALRASPDLFFEDQQADAPEIIPAAESAAKPERPTRWEDAISAEPEILTPNTRQQEPSTHRDVVDIGAERAWRELREIWDRGWAGDNSPRSIAIARHAFAMACAVADGGAAGIVAAARAWREAADAPRFLPRLADWLTGQGWAKPPPAKAKRGRAGGGRAERSRYDKPSLASCLRAIAEREA